MCYENLHGTQNLIIVYWFNNPIKCSRYGGHDSTGKWIIPILDKIEWNDTRQRRHAAILVNCNHSDPILRFANHQILFPISFRSFQHFCSAHRIRLHYILHPIQLHLSSPPRYALISVVQLHNIIRIFLGGLIIRSVGDIWDFIWFTLFGKRFTGSGVGLPSIWLQNLFRLSVVDGKGDFFYFFFNCRALDCWSRWCISYRGIGICRLIFDDYVLISKFVGWLYEFRGLLWAITLLTKKYKC